MAVEEESRAKSREEVVAADAAAFLVAFNARTNAPTAAARREAVHSTVELGVTLIRSAVEAKRNPLTIFSGLLLQQPRPLRREMGRIIGVASAIVFNDGRSDTAKPHQQRVPRRQAA